MKPDDLRRQWAVERATERYAASLRRGANSRRADGDSAGQTENYRDSCERAELRYTQVRQVLLELGVPPTHFLSYRNFGLHVDKLCRGYSGESLRLMVSDAITRWTCYGCNAEVLRAICEQVFRLEAD